MSAAHSKDHSASAGATVTVCGHFGEWLQGRMGPAGPVALVTLPCPALTVSVPGDDAPLFDAAALDRFASVLGCARPFPGTRRALPVGAGAGASTATLVALAHAAGFEGSPEALATACVAIEGASDPLMFADADRLLWASREGRMLRRMSAPPRCTIVGGFHGPSQRTDPGDEGFEDISDLVDCWDAATDAGDLPEVATLASRSDNLDAPT